ncbi:ankyrin repeat domain-containing protein [Campylobacter sp. CCS1377]|uniref:Ankyrin repeat domain-containing protein n=1 Tax=Campylobacter sp. CCS1377 TaxID=3158229 RepID=A0AAU7E6E6_9BACT|nr:ankyrin repeat domain-containing protein [Campylobacter jejuni]
MLRKILILCFFIVLLEAQDCNEILKYEKNTNPENFNQDLYYKVSTCKDSFKNQSFTQKLYQISNTIRGSNSACSGIYYLPNLKKFDFLLLKMALNPSLNSNLKDMLRLKKYFEYWAYQSIGNYRLYKEFWKEHESAKNALKLFYQNKNFDKNTSEKLSNQVLHEFLYWAVGDTKINKELSEFAKLIIKPESNVEAIESYIYQNNPSQAELSIALQIALLAQKDIKILTLFIKLGAKLNESYESAIFYALENYENTQFLITQGANVNQTNAFGKSPLFYAVEFNRKDIAQLLIENGANIHQKYINNNEKLALSNNTNFDTPYYITFCALEHTSKNLFMHAASYGDVEILKLLVAKGVKIFEIDDLGFNALDFALMANKKENVKYLKSLGLKENENLFYGGSLE